MRTRAAVVDEGSTRFEIRELEVDEPGVGEVHVRFVASGLCHSDLHLIDGDLVPRYPIVAGHEGSGIVETVGPGVTKVAPGDHVVFSFVPSCGTCRYCATGRSSVCDLAANSLTGLFPDGRTRYHADGRDYGGFCMLGTFSERATVSQHSVVKVDDWLPLETAVLVGCGVPTGWGTAVYAGGVRAGDTVVVYGIGGVGINAVQGAAYAGAKYVIVVDPVAFKRETALKLGATHAFATAAEAHAKATELTWGHGADQALVTVGVVDEQVVTDAFNVVGTRRRGRRHRVGRAGQADRARAGRGADEVREDASRGRCSGRGTRTTTSCASCGCTTPVSSSSTSSPPSSTPSTRSTRATRTCATGRSSAG